MLIPFKPHRKNKKRVRKLLRQIFPQKTTAEIESIIKDNNKNPHKQSFFIRHQQKIVGFVSFSTFAIFGKKFLLFVHSLIVDKKTRHQGIGSKVFDKIKELALQKKISNMMLLSSPSREKAHKFWKKLGFTSILSFLFYKKIKNNLNKKFKR